jgi:hypothetical protein
MKNLSLFLFAVLICTSIEAQVKSDYDRDTDFSQIKTYSFAGWEKDSDEILNDFDKERITKALRNEFTSRGLSYVESDSDVEITLYVVINKKTSTTAYTTYTGGMGYYGGRRGWGRGYGGVGMSTASTNYNESDYLEGTFVVNMFDENSKNLLWEGIITTVVKEKLEKREKSIPKKIKKLMKAYPVKPTK